MKYFQGGLRNFRGGEKFSGVEIFHGVFEIFSERFGNISGGVEIFSGGVEIFSEGLKNFKGVENLLRGIEKFQGN